MEGYVSKENVELLDYQAQRLQSLIDEMVHCCEERKLYQAKKFGLPYSELKSLMVLRGQRYLTVKGISEKLSVAKSRVTKIVAKLTDKGLVECVEDPKDGRFRLISLTPAGQTISDDMDGFLKSIHKDLLFQMDPDERQDMLANLELLRSAMEAVKEKLV